MLAQELVDRMKKAMKHRVPVETVDRSAELIPGMKYRNERGRMVTVTRVSHLRVMYRYEGYQDICEIGRREFELKFRKVQS
ncbi:DUF4222 domain-containing protein [Citrobacter sp. S46_ASV_140]|uniref:DUF4222 domain-containing protein n=1 Tax=Citrobacter sp. S46_ASV_140 TaxID=2846983 RepID=UPI001C0F2788|nr:DUF4222 domain-containing protein [Citrobacter sp. S46_ASV_140]MBU5640613.1 DUF4222 domain-containing protein [Citrobacter sp. S46_ASV_140]